MDDLTLRLGALAVEMQQESDAETTLRSIVEAAMAIVPGARWAGISFIDGKRVEPRVPSDPIVEELDMLQAELDEGPCLSALRDHRTVHIEDTGSDARWPRFSDAAFVRGVRSMLSFQLFVTDHNIGALNLYGAEAEVFDGDSVEAGRIVAQHASVALAAVASEAQFQLALSSRDIIGQAKGILIERLTITGVQAFALLTRLSQERNVKLVEVARKIVALAEATSPSP